jgi:hypothetical protein
MSDVGIVARAASILVFFMRRENRDNRAQLCADGNPPPIPRDHRTAF